MSKKKFKKFKKSAHKQSSVQTATGVSRENIEKRDDIIEEIESNEKVREEKVEPDFYDTDEYEHVKKDVKKILIIMVSIIVILFAIYYLSLKTTYLTTAGNWIYKILNIQAG